MGDPRYIDVDGTRTRYFEAGSGTPLVLVGGGHFGTPYAATDWDLNFAGLAARHRVIAVDKLGQGHTDNPRHPDRYVIGSAVRHLQDFVRAMGVQDAHFVGHSRGGYAVCRTALEAPELVRSLVIVDSGTLMHQRSAFYPELAKKMASIDDVRERYEFSIGEQSFAGSMSSAFWLDDILSFVVTEKFVEAARIVGLREQQFSDDLVVRQRELRDRIGSGALGSTPVLLIWGYDDRGAPIDECAIPALHLFMSSTPDTQMHVFNRSGHFPFREWPDEFNALLASFLRRVDSGVGGERRRPPLGEG